MRVAADAAIHEKIKRITIKRRMVCIMMPCLTPEDETRIKRVLSPYQQGVAVIRVTQYSMVTDSISQ